MNWFDVGLALLVVISVVSGVREGFSRSGCGFVAVVLAFMAAAWISPSSVQGFVIVFVLAICAFGVASFAIGRWFRVTGEGWLDRLLGAAFGLTNALLFAVFVVLAVMAFAPKAPRHYIARSHYAPYVLEAARTVADAVPDEMRYRVEQSYEELVHVLPPEIRKAMPPARI